jgi:tetratricopeptide (TPR) repeat protein
MAAERKGWIAELFARRVPQIVGVYIGACWMTVEIGDWVTERVGAPPDLIAYVFVLMIALLPSVAVLAWNHGAPGKDRSPRFEKLFVPANLVAALVAVVAFFGYAPPGAPGSSIPSAESAVVERTVVDETGAERTFTVARAGFHRLVFTSFYGLDEGGDGDGRDWRRYAAAWLVMVALNRDPLISVVTPYRNGVASDYIEAGYPDALGEPRALAVRQAQRIGARYVVRGGLSRSDSGIRLRATVIEAESGAVTGEVEADGADLVEASAALALELRPLLAPDLDEAVQRFTRVPLAEAATPSIEALTAMVDGLNALHLERDFDAATRAFERALEIDPAFALAAVSLHELHRSTGDFAAAVAAADRALVHDYKLDSMTRFAMKANRHALAGDYATAMRVLRMWTEVHPDSFNAWMTLARNQIVLGEVEAAAESLRRARELDPDNAAVLRQMATTDQLAGDFDAAADRLRAFIEREPADVRARIELGRVLARAGRADAALTVFEEAELLADDPLSARLSKAVVWIRQGRFDRAEPALDALMESNTAPARRAEIVKVRLSLLSSAGRYRELIAAVEAHRDMMLQVLQPSEFWSLWSEYKSRAHIAHGELDAAAAAIDESEAALGEPFGRFRALDRIKLLIRTGGSQQELERQLERLRFFEDNFSFGGVLAIVRWGEALVRSHGGATEQAVSIMREARDRYRATGLSLNMGAVEFLDLELARLLIADGRSSEARALLDELLTRHPAMAEARWERIELARAAGDADALRAHLDLLLDQWDAADPGMQRLREARALREGL